MEFVKLFGVNDGGRSEHDILALVVLREGDIVPDGIGSSEKGADAVKSESKASVRGSAVLEGVDEESELALHLLRTDADDLEAVRGGVPCMLLSLPVRYMHTSVETFDMRALEESARLLAACCAAIDDTWRDDLWI